MEVSAAPVHLDLGHGEVVPQSLRLARQRDEVAGAPSHDDARQGAHRAVLGGTFGQDSRHVVDRGCDRNDRSSRRTTSPSRAQGFTENCASNSVRATGLPGRNGSIGSVTRRTLAESFTDVATTRRSRPEPASVARDNVHHGTYLVASTSAARISGGAARSSSALAISAAAISPLMCAWCASSVPKVSKIQNVVGEVGAVYQLTVPSSASASGSACALLRRYRRASP